MVGIKISLVPRIPQIFEKCKMEPTDFEVTGIHRYKGISFNGVKFINGKLLVTCELKFLTMPL